MHREKKRAKGKGGARNGVRWPVVRMCEAFTNPFHVLNAHDDTMPLGPF